MGNDRINKRLDTIEGIVNQLYDIIERLEELVDDKNAEIRLRAIEAMGLFSIQEAKDCIYKALSDSDEIVRTTCVEIIANWNDISKGDTIISMLSDDSELVRTSAAITIGYLNIKDARNDLINRLKVCGEEERVGVYFALCKLGNIEYLVPFLDGLLNDFYRVRCSTANLLIGIVDEKNRHFIINLLSSLLPSEKTEAAKSSIKNALDDLKK